ncbi:MAG: TraB/GumN family protein [Candidatus Bathyarchaeota archaeon]|jgi:pheromone shutdown protein TraB|nr:TraB/GumN family protein [Candidatus Bathyarchaeota archaeon]
MVEIINTDYNQYVDLIGTAHFTRRSICDAYDAVTSLKPKDIALELDWRRFQQLSGHCIHCNQYGTCKGICEFTGAADALGNVNANIWLIDMSEHDMRFRMMNGRNPWEQKPRFRPLYRYTQRNPVRLWEQGYKEQVVEDSKRMIEYNRRISPSVWRVLIDERNAMMAARLSWIITAQLNEDAIPHVLALVGAAHVEGIQTLLEDPQLIRSNLRTFRLSFTEPTLIRRVAVTPAA